MLTVKRLIVKGMSRTCWLIDGIRPGWIVGYTPLRWLGCPCGLALWSSKLDERWGTGEWK